MQMKECIQELQVPTCVCVLQLLVYKLCSHLVHSSEDGCPSVVSDLIF